MTATSTTKRQDIGVIPKPLAGLLPHAGRWGFELREGSDVKLATLL